MPRVDVVIATYNRPDRLVRCLEALALQTYRDFGVVVVDDASPQPVDDAITAGLRTDLHMRVLRLDDNHGPGRARNVGVRQSGAELIAFVDDDVVADPALLANHVGAYDRGEPNTIQFGPLSEPRDWRPTPWNLWEARTLAFEYKRMQAGVYRPSWRQFFTGNAFVPRDLFLATGGFDEFFTRAEDIEFAYRVALAGGGVRFVPEAIGWHYAERTRSSWQRIARDYARFDVTIDRNHPELAWLQIRRRERESRNAGSRLGYELLKRTRTESAGVNVAISLASATSRLGLQRAAHPLLSFAYSVEYERSLAAAVASTDAATSVTAPPAGAAV